MGPGPAKPVSLRRGGVLGGRRGEWHALCTVLIYHGGGKRRVSPTAPLFAIHPNSAISDGILSRRRIF